MATGQRYPGVFASFTTFFRPRIPAGKRGSTLAAIHNDQTILQPSAKPSRGLRGCNWVGSPYPRLISRFDRTAVPAKKTASTRRSGWREALLAQKVLQGTLAAISAYLWAVHDEATRRGFEFDASKITRDRRALSLTVTKGQLAFEHQHLMKKLRRRNLKQLLAILAMIAQSNHTPS
jgi:hypothetical protein